MSHGRSPFGDSLVRRFRQHSPFRCRSASVPEYISYSRIGTYYRDIGPENINKNEEKFISVDCKKRTLL